MPAFTFEKLSPPVRRTQQPPNVNQQPKKSRGVIGLIKDRFVQRRLKKSERGIDARGKSSD
ncbi:hypothetical protein [Bradyrhizobium sp.]|uniref:hypothetical protein n=1 Tax=Bradyrhizobium sp. TaxID=376 RepID=UPI003C47269C